jgi:hypothetical protein
MFEQEAVAQKRMIDPAAVKIMHEHARLQLLGFDFFDHRWLSGNETPAWQIRQTCVDIARFARRLTLPRRHASTNPFALPQMQSAGRGYFLRRGVKPRHWGRRWYEVRHLYFVDFDA